MSISQIMLSKIHLLFIIRTFYILKCTSPRFFQASTQIKISKYGWNTIRLYPHKSKTDNHEYSSVNVFLLLHYARSHWFLPFLPYYCFTSYTPERAQKADCKKCKKNIKCKTILQNTYTMQNKKKKTKKIKAHIALHRTSLILFNLAFLHIFCIAFTTHYQIIIIVVVIWSIPLHFHLL
jgi:hypothetical protein